MFQFFAGKQLRKLPRLTEADIITIKRPEIVRAKSNGRMGFAPLFEKERRQKMAMLKQVVKIMKNPTTTTTTTSTTTTTTTTRPTTTTTIKSFIQRTPEEILGLPELPPQFSPVTDSPIFQLRVEAHPKSFPTKDFDNEVHDQISDETNGEKWQLIPPVQASKSIVRFRVDPEQPVLKLEPPPKPSIDLKPPVSPFQIVGHVMSDDELKSFPDSPIVNISNTNSNNARMPKLVESIRKGHKKPEPMTKRTGKSSGADNGIGLPVQLNTPGGGLPGPLVWISPASLARSPMVNLRRLPTDGHHVRPPNVERSLTMVFPGRQRRRFEKSCLACLSNGGLCPHCLVV